MINFTKVHGNGNDFIVLENLDLRHSPEDLARLARLLCRRNFSIGADGILVVEPAANADFLMRIFNSDGSESGMCGNGARAIARYALVKGLAGPSMRFATLVGPMLATVEPPYVELDMGYIPLKDAVLGQTFSSHGMEFPFVFMIAAIPHCVLWAGDYAALSDAAKFEIGREAAHDASRFPCGTNVTFAQALTPVSPAAPRAVLAVTYEAGVEDLTKSCGTGSVATAIALSLREDSASWPANASRTIAIRNPGGVNEVRLEFSPDRQGCRAWLKGRTAIVAEGRALGDAMSE